jgi:hypothetical protein
MVSKSTLAFCIAAVVLCLPSMAFDQSREIFGPVLPMVYDGQGGRHYCLYGYHGPFDPSIDPKSDYTTVVCPRESPRVPWLWSAQQERFSWGKARAQTKRAKVKHRTEGGD